MVDINKLIATNAERWRNSKVHKDLEEEFDATAERLIASVAKARYKSIEAQTGVPWWVISVIHEREASQKWTANLAQGDPWNEESTHVPKGRGPFNSFESAACDALANCAPYASRWKDWSSGGTLTLLEEYNGLGYAMKGIPSPYIWAGTDQYDKGKYVADGVFDANVVDHQLGCAGLITSIMLLDPSVNFGAATPPVVDHVPTPAIPPPPISNPTKHVGAGGAGAGAGAAAAAAGLPIWAVILIAVIVGGLVWLILHSQQQAAAAITPPPPPKAPGT
jgi:lysozyme family protein